MFDQQVVAFAAVAALLVMTPGLDMALVMKNALRYGQRAALVTALGINFGVFIWTAAAAVGVAALVRASETGFTVLKRPARRISCTSAWRRFGMPAETRSRPAHIRAESGDCQHRWRSGRGP